MGGLGIALGIGGALAALLVLAGVVLHFVGRGLPVEHSVRATLDLRRPPEEVFAAIADVASWPQWDSGVDRVEVIPSPDGVYRVRMRMGRNVMALARTVHEPPRRLEMTIEDEGAKMFSGCWRHEIEPTAEGCRVVLVEDGRIHFALPRAIARKLADPALYLKRHLRVLAAKFGEAPRLS